MSKLLDEVSALRKKIQTSHIPPDLEVRVIANFEEMERLEHDISARVHIEQMLRYTEWIINLPWENRSIDQLDLDKARQILQAHHYGLEPVKRTDYGIFSSTQVKSGSMG